MSPNSFARSLWASFSYVGLAVAVLLFAASLSPSLLPRHYIVQGILSGMALAVGYGVGILGVWLWKFLELPEPHDNVETISKRITTIAVAATAGFFLWRATIWQNSIRELMEMEPIVSAYPSYVAVVAVVVGVLLLCVIRWIIKGGQFVHRQISRFVPRRISYFLSALIVVLLLVTIADRIVARQVLYAADAIFLKIDGMVDEGVEQPADELASGSAKSLIAWDSIGKQGKDFIVLGPSEKQIAEFLGKEVKRPLRIYVGLGSRETSQERAQLALEELKRVGGFDRSVLIVATPTGTGWLDPGAVDTVEYLHGGDTAIVSMQYSYLPSWITILVDPNRSRDSARTLFNEIYSHWKTLPEDSRPKLYLHGLSLGSLGSEVCADLFTLFEDPIQGGLWSGPPFPSTVWAHITRRRNRDSPVWLPRYREGQMVRFTGREKTLSESGDHWGAMRFVYLQHASDPMIFFSPNLAYRPPDWLNGERGPDVSPYLSWYPIITFLQLAFDLPMATSVPTGYGHNYHPESYLDAWIEITSPPNWTADDTQHLKELLAK
ncbi:alpha/beta-hydrolase family protein [Pirellulales bacterium]|nr:alpha/beta-hydrolase family protein [Pirellulales bacterium]